MNFESFGWAGNFWIGRSVYDPVGRRDKEEEPGEKPEGRVTADKRDKSWSGHEKEELESVTIKASAATSVFGPILGA